MAELPSNLDEMEIVHCAACLKQRMFDKGNNSIGPAVGFAWFAVEVRDGASPDPLVIAQVCSPDCMRRFLAMPCEDGGCADFWRTSGAN